MDNSQHPLYKSFVHGFNGVKIETADLSNDEVRAYRDGKWERDCNIADPSDAVTLNRAWAQFLQDEEVRAEQAKFDASKATT